MSTTRSGCAPNPFLKRKPTRERVVLGAASALDRDHIVCSADFRLIALAVGVLGAPLALCQTPPADTLQALSPSPSAPPSATGHRGRAPRAATSTVENKVRLLTSTLGLDTSQQARLTELLEREQREVRKLWVNSAPSGGDRVGPTLAIIERTKDEIRAMLTESQKEKYPAAVRREALAPAQADPEYWMGLTRPRAGEN